MAKKRASKKTSADRGGRAAGGAWRAVRGSARGAWSAIAFVAQAAWRNPGAAVFGVVVIAIAAGWVLGREALEQRVAQERGGAIDVRVAVPSDADVSSYARLGVDPRGMLRSVAARRVTPDPFDEASLAEAADALEATGWFGDGGVTVRREPGGVVRVTGSWRVPTVVVAWRGGEFLVDADGRVMADPGPSDALSAEFLRVRGPMLGPVRDDSGRVVYGAPWPGGDVQEAIGLLAYLHEREGALLSRIAAVDLSAYESTPAGELRLVTDRGGVLVWGAPVGASAGGEVSVDRKVEQLRAVLEELREIDRAGSVIPVNLPGVYLDQTIGRAAGGASDG